MWIMPYFYREKQYALSVLAKLFSRRLRNLNSSVNHFRNLTAAIKGPGKFVGIVLARNDWK